MAPLRLISIIMMNIHLLVHLFLLKMEFIKCGIHTKGLIIEWATLNQKMDYHGGVSMRDQVLT